MRHKSSVGSRQLAVGIKKGVLQTEDWGMWTEDCGLRDEGTEINQTFKHLKHSNRVTVEGIERLC